VDAKFILHTKNFAFLSGAKPIGEVSSGVGAI
jgi:hypothetical protein